MKLASDNTIQAESEATSRITDLTLDGWISALTGMGIVGKDKNANTVFRRAARLPRDTLDNIYRQDPLATRIIDVIVDDAMRQGFTLSFKGEGDEAVDPELVNDIVARTNKWIKTVKMVQHVKDHLKQARVYGGSLLVMGINDTQDPLMPVNPDTVQSFTFLKALDRFQMSASGLLNTDPESCDFGFPAWYHLNSIFGSFELVTSSLLDKELSEQVGVQMHTEVPGSGGTEIIASGSGEKMGAAMPTLNNVTVHTSRVVRTDGTVLTDRARLDNNGWGDSIFERVFEPLKNWNTVMNSSGTLVHDMNRAVYGIRNLNELIQANNGELLMKRFQMMEHTASQWNATLIDADGESFVRTETKFTGLPELIEKFGVHLAAAASMPVTLIMGISPSGFGTGEGEATNWNNVVKAYQDEDVTPVIEQIFEQLFRTPEFNDVPENWEVDWHPLVQMSEAEKAEIAAKMASADAAYVTAAVLSPHEVALSRFGGENYSLETQLDEEMRGLMKPAEGEEEEAVEKEAEELNAATTAEGEEGEPAEETEETTPEEAEETTPEEDKEEAPEEDEPEEGADVPAEEETPEEGDEEATDETSEAVPETPAAPAPPPTPTGALPSAAAEPIAAVAEAGGPTDPDAADPGTAFAGGQVAAMTKVIGQVMVGELPLESAVMVLTVSFPLSEEEARAMLAPAMLLQEEKMAEKAANKAAMDPAMQNEMSKPGPGAQPPAPPVEGEAPDVAAPVAMVPVAPPAPTTPSPTEDPAAE